MQQGRVEDTLEHSTESSGIGCQTVAVKYTVIAQSRRVSEVTQRQIEYEHTAVVQQQFK